MGTLPLLAVCHSPLGITQLRHMQAMDDTQGHGQCAQPPYKWRTLWLLHVELPKAIVLATCICCVRDNLQMLYKSA